MIQRIEASKEYSAEAKRTMIDALKAQRNERAATVDAALPAF